MENARKINGKQVDIIEYFRDMALVQDICSKDVYLAYYWEFDSAQPLGYNNNNDSNVVSLEGWLIKWLEKERVKKRNQQKKCNRRQNLAKILPLK